MEDKNQEVILEMKDLSISFFNKSGEIQAVRGINYTLHKGEVLGIVGESGSGKSVSSHGILRLTPDTGKVKTGEILFHGKDILKMNKKELQELRGNKIAMIFQDPMTSLDPLFTVEYQLNESLKKHTNLDAVARKARMIELLTLVGINQPERRIKQYPYEFSGGMRQRVMIAMALVCKPEILIADEPTTALDVTIQAQILDLMNQLKKETGTSILFITHDLGVVAEVCDDVAVMYCGRVVERGDVKTIFANPSHPYTKGLLGSIPRLGDAGKELKSIPGNVPNPKYMPKGCKFAPRCPYASEKCREEEPGFFQIEEGHISRCWLCESGQLKTDHVEKAGD